MTYKYVDDDFDFNMLKIKKTKKLPPDLNDDELLFDKDENIEQQHRARVTKENTFIFVDQPPTKRVSNIITPEEKELRALKVKFKKLRGYKPTGMTINELRTIINKLENR